MAKIKKRKWNTTGHISHRTDGGRRTAMALWRPYMAKRKIRRQGTKYKNTKEMTTDTNKHKTGDYGVFMLRPLYNSGSTTAGIMMKTHKMSFQNKIKGNKNIPKHIFCETYRVQFIVRKFVFNCYCTAQLQSTLGRMTSCRSSLRGRSLGLDIWS